MGNEALILISHICRLNNNAISQVAIAAASDMLTPAQRARLIERLATMISAIAETQATA